MSPTVSILITGAEVLDGRIRETNSNFLIEQLSAAGLGVHRVAMCQDSMSDIVRSLSYLFDQSTVVICSGGLGPTTDDLTREAISEFTDRKLVLHGDVLGRLESYFRSKQRPFDPSNCKQALFPEGGVTIDNPVGSALGFSLRLDVAGEPSRILYALPGVPAELKAMITGSVIPALHHEFALTKKQHQQHLRVFGVGESVVGTRVKGTEPADSIAVSYRAHFPEVEVVFKGENSKALQAAANKAKEAIGAQWVYSDSAESGIEYVLHTMLSKKRLTLGGAESCTGGMISSLLTNLPGSSKYFYGSVISYSNQIKEKVLDVEKKLIKDHGAVSPIVAQAMAEGARHVLDTDIAFSVTGVAGPDGGTARKPVGLFYVGFADEKGSAAYRFYLNSNRANIRRYASWMALDVIRRHLLKLPVVEHENPYK